ncbi:TetR/AcrR family transcriptional regulator [Candidimonas nitroreducens]|uniref:TetR family transcriptional regulator n=1 Tax=Candidimonas nitroreducens TaxID=683354 RepID=A0A225N5V5_9BURK|nr:TetR/AcrR family transcriptional regulator [Candidimonas nitroreducens]OWT66389.1 TetR family transcriptional regulator [Candidimonas nitroreducens]
MVAKAKTEGLAQIRRSRTRRVLPAEVRVGDLMSAAAALFIAKGIEATTVNDIVERAGVGKGTFYHYFETKEDVIVALRERFSRDFTAEVAQAVASCPTDDHRARFAAWLRGTVEAYIANYKLHDVVFHEFRPGNRNVKDKEIVLAQLGELLAAGEAAGAWKLPDARTAAIVIFDGMHGVVDDAIAGDQREAEPICRRLSELFSRMLSG